MLDIAIEYVLIYLGIGFAGVIIDAWLTGLLLKDYDVKALQILKSIVFWPVLAAAIIGTIIAGLFFLLKEAISSILYSLNKWRK